MATQSRRSRAFSLLEVMIVISIMGILAGLVLPSFEPSQYDTLNSAAEVVAGDLAYARSLAVTNGDAYKLTYDLTLNRYTLTHSGTNSALNALPRTSFRSKLDSSTSQVTDLSQLPHMGAMPTLLGVVATSTVSTSITNVEFGSLGQTTQTNPTVVWLATGVTGHKRYMSVTVNPTTGLATIGVMQAITPTIPGASSGTTGS